MTPTETEQSADTQINVAHLLKSAIGTTRKIHLDVPSLALGEDRQAHAIEGDIKLLRLNRGLLVTGSVNTKVDLTCVRCLEEYTQPVEVTLEEEFRPSIDIASGAAVSYKDADADADADADYFLIRDDHVLDLNEALRQATWLAAPMMPRCREDCPGIPVPGGEPAEAAHEALPAATEDGVDARLAILGHLLAQADEDEPSDGRASWRSGHRRPRR